jgi:type I restriction enzyme S subunit
MADDGWVETTLGAIAIGEHGLVDGPFGSNLPASAYTPNGVPVIRGSNLSLGGARFIDREFVFVSHDTALQLKRSMCGPGDIIFTKKGTIGQTGFVPLQGRFERYLLSSNQMKLSVDPAKADPLFVYYVVSSPAGREKIERDASVTGVPKTNVTYLRGFPIRLPPLPEQRAIAHILGALDDKIELNRRMNETLEAIARSIFKSWFVDFDPVRAKAEGRDPGLPKHLADLFPDSFEESELGEIPRGWIAGKAGEVFNITMGQSPPGTTYNEVADGLPFFQGSTDFGFRFPTRRVYCSAPTRLAQAGDTLVSVRAPVGDINMAAERSCVGRGVAAVRHKSGNRSYTYYFMKERRNLFERFEADGTVFGSISKQDFHCLQSLVPPAAPIDVFERLAAPLDDRISNNEDEIATLMALRDALLPKLISGEIRIAALDGFRGESEST